MSRFGAFWRRASLVALLAVGCGNSGSTLGQPCGKDKDCSSEEICERGECTNLNDILSNVSGANIQQGRTDSEGRVYFMDSLGEEFSRQVVDKNGGQPLEGVEVTFIDHQRFQTFTGLVDDYFAYFSASSPSLSKSSISQPLFTELIEMVAEWDFTPVSADRRVLVTDYSFFSPQSNALTNVENWAQEGGYRYEMCLTKEQLRQGRVDTWTLLSLSLGGQPLFKFISTIYNATVRLEGWDLIDTLPNDIYHIWEPTNFTSLPLWKGSSSSPEIADGIDNDCNGQVDEELEGCSSGIYLACDERGNISSYCQGVRQSTVEECAAIQYCSEAICVDNEPECTADFYLNCTADGSGVDHIDSCGNHYVVDCDLGEVCNVGECVDDAPTCSPESYLSCSGGDVYWFDSCGNRETRADNCGSDETCVDGACVDSSTECDPAAGCSTSNCLFYDGFSGSSLDETCRWIRSTYGTIDVSDGILHLSEAAIFSKTPLACSDFRAVFRIRLSSELGMYGLIANRDEIAAVYDLGSAWAEEGLGCGLEETDVIPLSPSYTSSWRTIELQRESGQLRLFYDGVEQASMSCGLDGRVVGIIHRDEGELQVDYVQFTCND